MKKVVVASIDRTYAMVQKFKAAPDTATGEANRTFCKKTILLIFKKKGWKITPLISNDISLSE